MVVSSATNPTASQLLPRLGLGMAALGRPGYINLDRSAILGSDMERTEDTMQSRANVVMDRLLQLSKDNQMIPWLDCARSYGLSEKFVGDFLRSRRIAPNDVFVSSKWGYTYVADWNVQLEQGEPHEVKDHSVENFLNQLSETTALIGEYVNLYQVHSATFDSGILSDNRVHAALSKCRKERGWSIGLSVSGPKQNDVLSYARTILDEDGHPLFDSVQCTFNVLEQRPKSALQEARSSDMDIIIKEGLANGRALRNPSVQKYAKELDCQTDQLALACILAQSFAPRALSGAVTAEQLESNFEALRVSERLKQSPELLAEIMSSCIIDSEGYWSERSGLAWN